LQLHDEDEEEEEEWKPVAAWYVGTRFAELLTDEEIIGGPCMKMDMAPKSSQLAGCVIHVHVVTVRTGLRKDFHTSHHRS
jgi:hypothetical protein